MRIKIGNIEIYTYKDKCNPAIYTIAEKNEYDYKEIILWQSEMELLVANLTVLVNQNKEPK